MCHSSFICSALIRSCLKFCFKQSHDESKFGPRRFSDIQVSRGILKLGNGFSGSKTWVVVFMWMLTDTITPL